MATTRTGNAAVQGASQALLAERSFPAGTVFTTTNTEVAAIVAKMITLTDDTTISSADKQTLLANCVFAALMNRSGAASDYTVMCTAALAAYTALAGNLV